MHNKGRTDEGGVKLWPTRWGSACYLHRRPSEIGIMEESKLSTRCRDSSLVTSKDLGTEKRLSKSFACCRPNHMRSKKNCRQFEECKTVSPSLSWSVSHQRTLVAYIAEFRFSFEKFKNIVLGLPSDDCCAQRGFQNVVKLADVLVKWLCPRFFPTWQSFHLAACRRVKMNINSLKEVLNTLWFGKVCKTLSKECLYANKLPNTSFIT